MLTWLPNLHTQLQSGGMKSASLFPSFVCVCVWVTYRPTHAINYNPSVRTVMPAETVRNRLTC